MIKDLTMREIAACSGARRLEERTHGLISAAFLGCAIGCTTYMLCRATGMTSNTFGQIATALLVSVSAISTFINTNGSKYTVDLDEEDNDNSGP